MTDPLVSVVTPVYNDEPYLEECIRSVLSHVFSPQAKNFNFALREISGRSKYCKMLLSDDWMYPECLRQLIDVAEPNPRIAVRQDDRPGVVRAAVAKF